jgi:hypothetical protein
MPKTTGGNASFGLHYDQILTNISLKYSQPGLVAPVVFPTLPVKKESDLYPVYDLSNFVHIDDARQDGEIAREASWGWRLEWYRTEQHSLRAMITPRMRENVDNAIDLEVDTTNYLTEQLLLNWEIAAARFISDPANNGFVQNLNNGWDNYLTCSPKTDITLAKNAIFRMTGRVPNVMIVPATIASRMLLIEEIKEERKYVTDLTQSGLPNPLWGLRVIEAQSLRAPSSPVGSYSLDPRVSTPLQEVWGNNVWIGYVDTPGVRKITYGVTFESRPRNVRTYVEPWRDNATWIEVDWMWGIHVIAPPAGALLQNVMTPA